MAGEFQMGIRPAITSVGTTPPGIGSLMIPPPGSVSLGSISKSPMVNRNLDSKGYLERMMGLTEPFTQAGNAQLPQLLEGSTGAGYASRLGEIMQNPMFKDLLSDQKRGLDASLAASGMRRSGSAVTANANLPMELAQQLESQATQRSQALQGMGADGTRNQNDMAMQIEQIVLQDQAAAAQRSAQRRSRNTAVAGAILSLAFSDARLKENIKPIGQLENGHTLYEWEWNDKASQFGLSGKGSGVIAQEIYKTNPELVDTSGEYWKVNTEVFNG